MLKIIMSFAGFILAHARKGQNNGFSTYLTERQDKEWVYRVV